MTSGRLSWLVLSAVGAALAVACGSGAVGVQACRDIESARCQAAPACPSQVDLSQPVPSGDPVAACVRFYNDQCLHGLETTAAPSNAQVNTCVSTILAAGKAAARGDAGACDTVAAPETAPACAFLAASLPDASVPDAAGPDTGQGD